jgi:hypothetical protein
MERDTWLFAIWLMWCAVLVGALPFLILAHRGQDPPIRPGGREGRIKPPDLVCHNAGIVLVVVCAFDL